MLEFMMLGGEYVPVFRCFWCCERITDPKLAMAAIGPDSEHCEGKKLIILHKNVCSHKYTDQLKEKNEILVWYEFDTTIAKAMDEAGFNLTKTFKREMLL